MAQDGLNETIGTELEGLELDIGTFAMYQTGPRPNPTAFAWVPVGKRNQREIWVLVKEYVPDVGAFRYCGQNHPHEAMWFDWMETWTPTAGDIDSTDPNQVRMAIDAFVAYVRALLLDTWGVNTTPADFLVLDHKITLVT